MGYRGGELAEFFHEGAIDTFAERACDDVTEEIEEQGREGTPVHTPKPGEPERARKPGTMKRRWKRDPAATRLGRDRWTRSAFNDDPQAVHVEYDTKPHIIRPRADRAPASVIEKGTARGDSSPDTPTPALRFYWSKGGGIVYFAEVHHPGTRGKHMTLNACRNVQGRVTMLMEPAAEAWAREHVRQMVHPG